MTAAYRRPLFAAALALFLFQAPAAMAYEGLTSSSGEAPSSGGGGYDGLVGWPATQGASNPYGTAPAEDIYGLVKGTAATTPEQRAENARRAREEQKLQRQQEMRERNLKRAQEMQSKLDAQSDAQQRRIMEHQNDIMRRMQQQQRQQQPR